jgi:TRAP-type C4-dicarboxylate transport system permease small subunit
MPLTEPEPSLAERVDSVASQGPTARVPVAETAFGRRVDRIAEVFAVGLLGIIVILVFLNSLGRFAFSYPLVWTEEVVATLIIWLSVAGAFLALRSQELITVEVLTSCLPPVLRHGLQVVIQLTSALIFAYLAWLGWRYFGLFGADRTPYFGFPKGAYMLALVVGWAAMAIVCLLSCARRRPGR